MPDAQAAPSRPVAVVLHGELPPGAGPEDADVLEQAALASAALERLGYRAEVMALGSDLGAAAGLLRRHAPAVVFNLVEGIGGDGRLIHLGPRLLEDMGLPFTGAGRRAMALTSDKLAAKRHLRAWRLPTPDWTEGPAPHEGRWIVKSVWEHASFGLDGESIVAAGAVPAALARRRQAFGGDWFAERFVDGREFNLSLLAGPAGPAVLPPAEIRFVGYGDDRPRIVDYAAKWLPDSYAYNNTPRTFDFDAADGDLLDRLAGLAHDCWRCFDLAGYARVDFRVDADGRPWILEINANPCLAADAGFMAAAAAAGLDTVEVVRRILDDRRLPLPA